MDLSREISGELWEAICTSYQAGHFSHAIVDTMHHLSDAIRNKSGLDGDGTALVGQALGGESPRLRVNNMQTESERNVQRGLEQILRGMYLGIRNPRSHDKHDDTKEIADAIIVFVNYLMRQLEASKEAFTPEAFLASLLDPEFVGSMRYAELLTNEVPTMRRADALLAIYNERLRVDLNRTANLITSLISQLSQQQVATYLAKVSEELRTSSDDIEVRTALQMLTPDLWSQLDEVSRLRIENKLTKSIEGGKVLPSGKMTGALGTWACNFLKVFSTRESVEAKVAAKMLWGEASDRAYISKYFMTYLPDFVVSEFGISTCVDALSTAVRDGEDFTKRKLVERVAGFPDTWQEKLAAMLGDLADEDKPAVRLRNGSAFLFKDADDDIPF